MLLLAKNELLHEDLYKHSAKNGISIEKQYELANSAMDFGLFESAAEIYESLLGAEGIEAANINLEVLRFSLIKAYIGSRDFESAE